MARFVNESGSVLRSFEHGWVVGPTEELDWPDYDAETHGATPGLRRLDEPTPAKRGRGKSGDDGSSGDESGGTPAQAGDSDPASTTSTSAADAAGEENPR